MHRVLVHGCDGFDQSAAVVVAALMRHFTATLEVKYTLQKVEKATTMNRQVHNYNI